MLPLVALSLLTTASAWVYDSAGCTSAKGFQLDSTGRVNRTLPSGRKYLFHLPSAYNASNGAHPLVLSFHGGEYLNTFFSAMPVMKLID